LGLVFKHLGRLWDCGLPVQVGFGTCLSVQLGLLTGVYTFRSALLLRYKEMGNGFIIRTECLLQMWEQMDSLDMGCGGGSGSNTSSMFARAGLAVSTPLNDGTLGTQLNTGLRHYDNCGLPNDEVDDEVLSANVGGGASDSVVQSKMLNVAVLE
jgi:hypothetical protein